MQELGYDIKILLYFVFRVLQFNSCNFCQQMHTTVIPNSIFKNTKSLQFSDLTGPTSGTTIFVITILSATNKQKVPWGSVVVKALR
jgi:hypothetical protein